jgi:hypothetical protein
LGELMPRLRTLICIFPLFGLMPLMGGSIEGHVTNRVTGEGMEGVTLSVWNSARTDVPSKIFSGVTGEAGAFKIDDLPDGEYMVRPDKFGFFYSSVSGPPTARISGETHIEMQMSPMVSLRGRVLDPEGKPAEGITVKLSGTQDTMTDEDGVFSFENVRPGSWKLSATPKPQTEAKEEERIVTTYYPSLVERGQAQSIKVEDVDLFGYDIHLRTARARRIRGVVIGPDKSPEANATVVLTKRPSEAPTVMLWRLFAGQLPGDKPQRSIY